jgi:hypothetical protein
MAEYNNSFGQLLATGSMKDVQDCLFSFIPPPVLLFSSLEKNSAMPLKRLALTFL